MDVLSPNDPDQVWKEHNQRHRTGRIIGGLLLIAAGFLFLFREMGYPIPRWVFTWQMLLIGIGLITLIKSGFRSLGGYLMILIGSAFLVKAYIPQFDYSNLIWPIAIIMVGLYVLFKPRNACNPAWRESMRQQRESKYTARPVTDTTGEDAVHANAIFGSVEKTIISKNFLGGEVNAIFGGLEINLSQADIQGEVIMEVNSIFGGSRLIIPPHWDVKTDLNAVLGGVEDKRTVRTDIAVDHSKRLILKGAAIFGGIEINSY